MNEYSQCENASKLPRTRNGKNELIIDSFVIKNLID